MKIKSLRIKNFRALADINVDFETSVSVIVGPNAVGKTTILEAIRLLKALLAPRTANEQMQTMFALGLASPHLPQNLLVNAIARNPGQPITIACTYQLTNKEYGKVESSINQIAKTIVQSRLGQQFANQTSLISFLSSPDGQTQLTNTIQAIKATLDRVRPSKVCNLEVSIDDSKGAMSTSDPIEASLVSFLESSLPPYKTLFTYFPADRALPAGEQPVQLGGADVAQQLESYNSMPQTKYARLKNLIFSASILGSPEDEVHSLDKEFEKIFNGILKGRKLLSVGINGIGLLEVKIQDTETKRVFDLDGMSSGEKGLILTFLLIERTVMAGGIILLDEPELHLNPAVCKDLLSYLIKEYVIPQDLQVIVCSHSPEILAGAFEDDSCGLYHLISENNLTKVRNQDQQTIADTLQKLGATESDELLYKGIIFVEGIEDVTLLSTGFSSILKRYKLKDSTGRNEVEKVIKTLQKAESEGKSLPIRYFIFDKDKKPTDLESSKFVKVLQWDRRCIDNYLIDLDCISNLLMDSEITSQPLKNHGEVSTLLRDTAFKQLQEVAARNVYERFKYESSGLRKEEIKGKDIDSITSVLYDRLDVIKKQLDKLEESSWKSQFIHDVAEEKKQLESIWQTSWQSDCDGKKLFEDLKRTINIKMDIRKFKTRLMREMMVNQSDSWKVVEASLTKLISE